MQYEYTEVLIQRVRLTLENIPKLSEWLDIEPEELRDMMHVDAVRGRVRDFIEVERHIIYDRTHALELPVVPQPPSADAPLGWNSHVVD